MGRLTSFPELSIPDADREARAIEALTTALRLLDKLTVSRERTPDFNFALSLGKLIALTRRRDPLIALCSRVDSYAWALSPRRRGRRRGVKEDPVSLILSKLPVGLQGLSGLPLDDLDDLPKIARRRGRPPISEDDDVRLLALLDGGRAILRAKRTRYTRKAAFEAALYERIMSDFPTPRGALDMRAAKDVANKLAAMYARRAPDALRRQGERGKK